MRFDPDRTPRADLLPQSGGDLVTDLQNAVAEPDASLAPGTSIHTHFRLCAHLRACRIGPHFIFLDLAASRYFLLEDEAAARFAAFQDGAADYRALDWLCGHRIIEPGVSASSAKPIAAARSLIDKPLNRPASWMVAEALALQLAARREVLRAPLMDILRPVAGSKDAETCSPVVAACQIAARYRSATDQCLPNAVAMRKMLARRGIASELVIGVMLPFAAHCWLQSGDVVLSDSFGRIQNFHPLAVA